MVEQYTNEAIKNMMNEDFSELNTALNNEQIEVKEILDIYEKELIKQGFSETDVKKEMDLIDQYYQVVENYYDALRSEDNLKIMQGRKEFKDFYMKY